MTEELDIMSAFQQIRQRTQERIQPRNLGLIAEALQEPYLTHNGFPMPSLPQDLDWTAIIREPYQSWAEPELDEDEDEDEENDNTYHVMDYMAWAYLPEEIKHDMCTRFYHGIPAMYQIILTIPDETGINDMTLTAATVEICRDHHTVQLRLSNEVIAWYTISASPVVDDKHYPIFFTYDYGKLGRFFLGAAQLLWGTLGYRVCIERERYIWDDETTPWETESDEELRDYTYNILKQFGTLSGDFGVFKKKIRNARRRRNLY